MRTETRSLVVTRSSIEETPEEKVDRMPQAREEAAFFHGAERDQRSTVHDVVTEQYAQLAELGADVERCAQHACDVHFVLELWVAPPRDRHVNGCNDAELRLIVLPVPHGGLAERHTLVVELVGFEIPEPVLQQLLTLAHPCFFARGTGDDRDQPLTVAQSRRDQTIARFLRVPGLHTVHGAVAPQQTIAVRLLDAVESERLIGGGLVWVRK